MTSSPPKRDRDFAAAAESASAGKIRDELNRIVSSAAFRHALRLKSFITFVVEATLAGKSDRIKAYTIAVEALDRGGDFDPQSDPIVRVEAGRLRRALARYYGGAGRDDALVIDLPRGTYVPVFRRAGTQTIAPTAPPGVDVSPPRGGSGHSFEIAARQSECEVLQTTLHRQASELAAEIRMARRVLKHAHALLRAQSDTATPAAEAKVVQFGLRR
jgi:hypothetical protein